MTGVPDKTKCTVAPASATAVSTAISILPMLKQVAALGKSRKLLPEIVLSQALAREEPVVSGGNQTLCHSDILVFYKNLDTVAIELSVVETGLNLNAI